MPRYSETDSVRGSLRKKLIQYPGRRENGDSHACCDKAGDQKDECDMTANHDLVHSIDSERRHRLPH